MAVGAVVFPTLGVAPQWWDYISGPGHPGVKPATDLPSIPPTALIHASSDSVSVGELPSGGTAGAVTWDLNLIRLVNALARTITDPDDIRRIKVQSGISTMHVVPDGTPLNRWQVIVERAAQEGSARVDRICELALAQSPRRELHEAVAAWRSAHDRIS